MPVVSVAYRPAKHAKRLSCHTWVQRARDSAKVHRTAKITRGRLRVRWEWHPHSFHIPVVWQGQGHPPAEASPRGFTHVGSSPPDWVISPFTPDRPQASADGHDTPGRRPSIPCRIQPEVASAETIAREHSPLALVSQAIEKLRSTERLPSGPF